MRKLIARIKARTDSGMETAQVILILGIVVGLIAVLFPAITGAIDARGKQACERINTTVATGSTGTSTKC